MSITDTTLSTTDLSDLTINLVFDSVSFTYPDRPELQICKKVDNGNLLIDLDTDNKVSHVSIPKPPNAHGSRSQHVWVPNNAPLEADEQALLFSPRTRGCSDETIMEEDLQQVFPAHAGMFLGGGRVPTPSVGFPRARGDVPPASGGGAGR